MGVAVAKKLGSQWVNLFIVYVRTFIHLHCPVTMFRQDPKYVYICMYTAYYI